MSDKAVEPSAGKNFLEEIIEDHARTGKYGGRVQTRFPPEPNGFLHIGHAKSICLNFSLAEQYGGKCNLRFDDTNPEKESDEFTEAIQEDIRWLGFEWDELHFTSNYYRRLHDIAIQLIKDGTAYVCDLTAEETREYRGTLKQPGRNSPYRDRSVEENLDLFARMTAGEFDEGSRILRAKIDMAAPNVALRDPPIYRIKKVNHHRTGDEWCVYPMYDFAHGLSDAIEGITHSICTLEFENNRPLYDWFVEAAHFDPAPKQYEFAKLQLTSTIVSKRNLRRFIEEGHVSGWDDPRMPTLRGLRRRGYPPAAIRNFCTDIGVSKNNSVIDIGKLETAVRDELNKTTERRMVVLDPIKLVITTLGDEQTHVMAKNHPKDESMGKRAVAFGRELYIDRDDFMEDPPKKYFRLAPGKEVRLRYSYIVRCDEVIHDAQGNVVELRCSHDPETLGKNPADGRKVKGTIHWVAAHDAVTAPIRLYDRLFRVESPSPETLEADLNPSSVSENTVAKMESSVLELPPGQVVQFERKGYFVMDPVLSAADKPVFHRTIGLRDSWANMVKKGKTG